jgi:dihydroorotate dehydrogenase
MFPAWHFGRFDPYRLLRPLFFRLDPEEAHTIALMLLKKGLGPKLKTGEDPVLHTSVCGLAFHNPVGLAAGFDKNAEVIDDVLDFGFGFAEIGTITPRPQPGNPKPRIFRAFGAHAVINRLGFNSDGMDSCLRRIQAWHDARQPLKTGKKGEESRGLVGINLGKNKDSEDVAGDYSTGFKRVTPYADYVTINISSPNTPGLRDLQNREELEQLLRAVTDARASSSQKPPLFVKIAPDLTDAQAQDIAEVALTSGIQGLIVGNTTVTRPGNLPPDFAGEEGGLSGKPLFDLSTQMLAKIYKLTQGKIPLIGCGGISSGADAYAKIRAGASLVQLYSALVFEGPGLVPRIKRDLAELLKRDGFQSVSEAVGKG